MCNVQCACVRIGTVCAVVVVRCRKIWFEISNIHDRFSENITTLVVSTSHRTHTQPERSVSETDGAHKRFSSMLKSNCLVHLPIEVVAGSPRLLWIGGLGALLAFYHLQSYQKAHTCGIQAAREMMVCKDYVCCHCCCCCCFDSVSMLSFNVLFPAYTFIHSFIHSFAFSVSMCIELMLLLLLVVVVVLPLLLPTSLAGCWCWCCCSCPIHISTQ